MDSAPVFRPTSQTGRNVFLFALWLAVFWPVYPELVSTWLQHSNNTHGILVPFISLFLIWHKKTELKRAVKEPSRLGGCIVVLALCLYLLGLVGQMAVLTRVMIIVSLIGLVWFNYGPATLKVLLFPLLFLFFMVPIPVSVYAMVSQPLQLFASEASQAAIDMLGIPVYREGNMLFFVQTQLEVAEACSGIRSLMAFTMLAVLLAYLADGPLWRRLVLVAAACPLAIVANILRVSGTGILAHFYGDQVARGFLHELSGILLFAFGFACLYALYSLFAEKHSESDHKSI